MGRTCGEPDEIKKNTHPKNITALFREQVLRPGGELAVADVVKVKPELPEHLKTAEALAC